MIYRLNNQFDRQQFREKCEWFLKRQVVVELKEKKQQRTLAQNRYLHLLLGYFGQEFGLTTEEVKEDIFKRIVNPNTFARKRNIGGVEVTTYRSSTSLDTGEMTLCIDRFRDYSLKECGLYLPEAGERDAILEIERMVAMAERYL